MIIEKELDNNISITESNKNIIKNLKENFWENIVENITEKIFDTNLNSIKENNKIIWKEILNSCFHPDEYWIWAYRTTSLINTAQLANELWLKVSIDYLDTKTNGWLKWILNPKLSSKKQKKLLFSSIEENSNNTKTTIKEKIVSWNDIFKDFINVSSFNNISNQNIVNYINELLKDLNIFDDISDFIEKKEVNNIKKVEKHKNSFVTFLLGNKIKEKLIDIKNNFKKNILNIKYKNWISKAEIYWELQNAIFTILINENFWDYREILEETNITNKWKFEKNISYNNEKTIYNFSSSFNNILNDKNLWEDFIISYFEKLSEKGNWRPVKLLEYKKNNESYSLFSYNENGKIKFFTKKWKEWFKEINNEEWFSLLSWKEIKKYNLSWSIILLIGCLSWQLHIWSERGYREVIAETLENYLYKNNNLNTENKEYIEKVIKWLWIFDTFDEGWDNKGKNLAGSVWTKIDDMTKLLFIWWDFSKDQIQKSIENNLETPEINQEKLFKSLLDEIIKIEWKILNCKNQKSDYFINFYDKKEKYSKEKNIENFLELAYYSYNIKNIIK